jgi:hypothetical protein
VASSTERLALVGCALLAASFVGCSDVPSKGDALDIVKRDVREDASCVLPASVFTTLKNQLMTKAACTPKEGPTAKAAQVCVDALVATGLVTKMPDAYMLEWPDDVAGRSLSDVPAYERRARKDVYQTCFASSAEMREGRFKCGEATADKVLRVTKADEKHADVRYARALTLDPKLADLDRACGQITRPPVEVTRRIEKNEKGTWGIPPPDVASP